MHILTIDIGSYTHADLLLNLKKMGYSFHNIFYHFEINNWELKYHNDEFEALLNKELENSYDLVMTTNFYPVIARICHEKGVKYIAWSYDSPLNLPGCDEMEHPTNYVFLFDKAEVKKYRDMGFDHFYHLPLAVNCDRLDRINASDRFKTDISMMGKLYESTLPELKAIMKPYHREFVDKLVETQLAIYGNWFVDQMLTDSIIDDMNAHFRSLSPDAIQITRAQLSYSIAQQITHIERITLLRVLHKQGFKVDLYTYPLTDSEKELLADINVHGKVGYADEMPALFKSSRINLNPTLKNISSGISLRALDILGCGGFLLGNFQPELSEYFEDGKEVVMYKSLEEAVDKAAYYLSHEDARLSVARKGYEKVRRDFNYELRITEMFKTAGVI